MGLLTELLNTLLSFVLQLAVLFINFFLAIFAMILQFAQSIFGGGM